MEIYESGRRNIVVLGAGFGGITALLKLYRGLKRRRLLGRYNLVLANRSAYHLYTPSLYEIAAIPKNEADALRLKNTICIPASDIMDRLPGARFIGEEAVRLDPERHVITFASGNRMNFEYLIVALGAQTNFFGIPGMERFSFPLKTFEDALRLRNRIEELAAANKDGALGILVGGGGATGVEIAAELVNFLCYLKKRMRDGACREEITLIEASPEILPGFSDEIIRRTKRRLIALGVKILTGKRIQEVRPYEIILDGSVLPYHLLVWAGGVRPSSVLSGFGLSTDERGGIVVNEFLEAMASSGPNETRNSGRIYAIGDNMSFRHPKTQRPLAGNVPVAESSARLASFNILAAIAGKERMPFRPLARYPFILAVGGKYAVTDLVIVKFFGFAGWALKQLVELRYLLFILPIKKAAAVWARAVYYSAVND
ncbi:MAG: NAD(P)/FAD-dependent oxidoreductase [Candidatus Sungbacteria bacterium]|uniref:NAD(P)/FAD-dependent oxidoreductase n=1 Tax=Candidatus Sungiibacteriota bacterium TaxID=2750080 RepID=A0A932YXW8_9BACT|nr:NAD(P)/FAD-dependent oxidoreductase [Candidatus Sungbacteria bacterium]